MKLVYLPLDDRPCNTEQVALLAQIARVDIVMPPADLFGGSDPLSLRRWFAQQARDAQAVVLSLDQFLYGGLVQSRKLGKSVDECERDLFDLARFMEQNPHVRYYLYSINLRLSVTVTGDVGPEVWRAVFEYSVEAEANPNSERLSQLKKMIPPDILGEYLTVRARNHAINLASMDFSPLTELIVFGQEDCAERGLHRHEKKEALQKWGRLPRTTQGRIKWVTGADELGSMLVAHAIKQSFAPNLKLPICIVSHSKETMGAISKYEDITLEQNLRAHADVLGIDLVSTLPRSHEYPVVHVSPFFNLTTQKDLCFEPEPPEMINFFEGGKSVIEQIEPGHCLLDMTYANGASPALLGLIHKKLKGAGGVLSLGGFSAWNTSGNRIGTLFAEQVLIAVSKARAHQNPDAQKKYLILRLLDDLVFQGVVRAKLWERAEHALLNPWALHSHWKEYSGLCDREMINVARHFGIEENIKSRLPWPRLFEVSTEFASSDTNSPQS